MLGPFLLAERRRALSGSPYFMECMRMNTSRKDEFYLEFTGGIPGGIFVSDAIPVEKNALKELDTIRKLAEDFSALFATYPDFFGGQAPRFAALSVSPDFHKGTGVPIGTTLLAENVAIPALMGGDIGCGMQFVTTDIRASEFPGVKDRLIKELRGIFFEGKRDLPLLGDEVKALFSGRLALMADALRKHRGSLWESLGDLSAVRWQDAVFSEKVLGQLADFTGVSRSAHLGSIGGGNHFVEIQSVDKIFEHTVVGKGCLGIMIHSGSLSIGTAARMYIQDRLKDIYPPGAKKPEAGFYPLPLAENGRHTGVAGEILGLIRNVLNFAAANRVTLGLMAEKALRNCGLNGSFRIFHDAAHNVMSEYGGETRMLHRKGSTPAELMEPVIIPGSMGTASYLLRGFGNELALQSAAHGAGRAVARQESMREERRL